MSVVSSKSKKRFIRFEDSKDAPFSQLYGHLSFSSSIGVGLALSACLSAPTPWSTQLYAISNSLFALALTLSLAAQFVLTSNNFILLLRQEIRPKIVDYLAFIVAASAYATVAIVFIALQLIGEALKDTYRPAGLLLQISTAVAALIWAIIWFTALKLFVNQPEATHSKTSTG